MEVRNLILSFLLLTLFSTTGLRAQGTPVPATDDSENVETTDATIDDLIVEIDDSPMEPGKDAMPTAGHMFEFGITPGYMWTGGDVEARKGWGAGAHLRFGLDHIFALRLDGLMGKTEGDNRTGDNNNNRRFEQKWLSGTGLVAISLNNFRYEGNDIRKVNLYALAGAGANFFQTAAQIPGSPFDEEDTFGDGRNRQIEREFAPHAAAGGGISVRLGRRVNVGVEYQALVPFGKRADLIDGYDQGGNFRDVQNFAGLNLNFNIGSSAKAEPRYWENAFAPVRDELDRVEGRISEATTDSDGDGVIDAIDVEANTPAGVPVDTRGKTLDSDKDGVPDYRDFEPFFPPGEGETVDANGVVQNRRSNGVSEARVQEMIDASLARFKQENGNNTTNVVTDRGAIYLPMIYFPLNQSTIKYSDYGTLSTIARVMEQSPGLRLVVRGYTDRVGTTARNQELSYRRAEAVINHLVNNHSIPRDRFILQYRGEENAIVPLDKTYVNRRVEFLTGEPGATEDPAPAGVSPRQGGY